MYCTPVGIHSSAFFSRADSIERLAATHNLYFFDSQLSYSIRAILAVEASDLSIADELVFILCYLYCIQFSSNKVV